MHAFLMDYREVVTATPDLGMIDTIKQTISKVASQDVVKFSKVIPIFLFIFLAPIIGYGDFYHHYINHCSSL